MICTLHIQTACANNTTYLKNCYCTTPFKVANITEDKKDPTLRLMLMSSSPGILDGDDYRLKIEVAENCSLQLHTQSYQRLFTMKEKACQQMEVHLAKDAAFCFIPHPAVPHEASDFTAKNSIFLSGNGSLIFGEILTCGRKLNGEVFLFSKYHTITEIFIHNKLVIKENLLMQPATINVNAIGQLQGYTHQASLIYLDEKADIKKIMAMVYELLSSQKEISVGVTAAPVNGLIVRILGQKAEQLFDCLKMIAGCLPQTNHHKPNAYAI
jgi:urease accessory protein